MCLSRSCIWYIFLFLMLQQPPRTTRTDPPFPTRRPSDRVLDRPLRLDIADDAVAGQLRRIADLLETALLRQDDMRTLQHSMVGRSEENTSELQSLMRISYAVFCTKKKTKHVLTYERQSHRKYKSPSPRIIYNYH